MDSKAQSHKTRGLSASVLKWEQLNLNDLANSMIKRMHSLKDKISDTKKMQLMKGFGCNKAQNGLQSIQKEMPIHLIITMVLLVIYLNNAIELLNPHNYRNMSDNEKDILCFWWCENYYIQCES